MPRGLNNWTFKGIVDFLKEHGFQYSHTHGSHFYYIGHYGGKVRQTHIQYHGCKFYGQAANQLIRTPALLNQLYHSRVFRKSCG